jgi:hypothetical protein
MSMVEPLRAPSFGNDDQDERWSVDGDRPPAFEAINSNSVVATEPAKPAGGNWPGALKLVERAAAMIKDYEQKFKDVEADARAFMKRVDEEQARLHAYIGSLEANIAELEERALETDTALHDVKIEAWEAKLKLRSAETRAQEAEAETQRSSAYVRRVEELLREI